MCVSGTPCPLWVSRLELWPKHTDGWTDIDIQTFASLELLTKPWNFSFSSFWTWLDFVVDLDFGFTFNSFIHYIWSSKPNLASASIDSCHQNNRSTSGLRRDEREGVKIGESAEFHNFRLSHQTVTITRPVTTQMTSALYHQQEFSQPDTLN